MKNLNVDISKKIFYMLTIKYGEIIDLKFEFTYIIFF